MREIQVPDAFLAGVAASEADFCRRVRRCDPLEAARQLAAAHREPLSLLETYAAGRPLGELRILEVGSGNGLFLTFALANGLDIVGIEPGRSFGFAGRHERAAGLLRVNGVSAPGRRLLDATAERLPFEDESFDLVFSVAVLEHVRDVDASVREALRVLRPGGLFVANVPNYRSWHEGHYDIAWLPGMGRGLARLWVSRVHGRDPSFVDELNFTTPADFARYLRLPGVSGGVYLHGAGLASRVFEACNLLSRGASPRPRLGLAGRALRLATAGAARRPLHAALRALTGACASLGLARTFDVVLRKSEAAGA